MLAQALLVASLFASSPTALPSADPAVSLTATLADRSAHLVEGFESLAGAATAASQLPVQLLPFDLEGRPFARDTGAGVDAETRQILALLLGLVVGFGTGHLVARDRDGFILFLIVDLAIVTVSSVFGGIGVHLFWPLGGVALLISHVIQAIDAYAEAGGARLVERARESAILVAGEPGGLVPGPTPAVTTRAFAFSF